MEALEFSEKLSTLLIDQAKFADAKAGALLALVGAIGAAMSTAAKPALEAAHSAGGVAELLVASVGVTVVGACAVTTWFCVESIRPRLPAAHSLSSFPDITRESPDKYVALVQSATAQDLLVSYCSHNFALAVIARAKHDAVRHAVSCAAISLFGAYVLVLVYGLAIVTGRSIT